ncbi:MAG: hypothetical protein K5886_04775 [Lachnospiraceae bacterium]|nr:hypothetical protein [Lachnospiraceae bacterium]
MEELEKIEKLRARANVTYEEAKAALSEANGDILDAMILLEKEGKVNKPEQQVHSTEYTKDETYEVVPVKGAKNKDEKSAGKFKTYLKNGIDYLTNNHLSISHHNEPVIDLPLWTAVLMIIIGWWAVLILIAVSLFFDWNYRFYGKNDLSGANNVVDKAKEAAEQVKEGFHEE